MRPSNQQVRTMTTSLRFWVLSGASAAFLAVAPAAFAAQSGPNSDQSGSNVGTTSGPAAGNTAVPNTAATKQMQTGQANGSGQSGTDMNAGAAGTGAAGTPAKPGSEAGPAPSSK